MPQTKRNAAPMPLSIAAPSAYGIGPFQAAIRLWGGGTYVHANLQASDSDAQAHARIAAREIDNAIAALLAKHSFKRVK